MSRYVLTPAADADLDEIWAFVAHQSGLERARRLEDQLHQTMLRLARHPEIGHVRNDLADESLWIFALRAFLIAYRPHTNPLQIIRVLHGARDVRAILAGLHVAGPAVEGPPGSPEKSGDGKTDS